MSLPPPPNPYGGQPSYGGQPPYGGQPQWGGQQPGAGEGQFSGPPPWGGPPQQPQWGGPPPGPPPGKGGKGKWILGGVIVLLVIALAVTITVLVVKPNSDGPSTPPTNNADSEFASANDTGPVNIITEDPTCGAWGRVALEYSRTAKSVNWGQRDQSLSADAWTPDQTAMYQTVGDALTKAADQAVGLSKQTPHRTMRELYQEFVAYARALVGAIPTYVADDRYLAGAADGLASAIAAICSAIDYESAQRLAPLVTPADPPSPLPPLQDSQDPSISLSSEDPVCPNWSSLVAKFDADTVEWRDSDPSVPAEEWTAEQRSVNDRVKSIMSSAADQYQEIARASDNATFQDLGILTAQYQRGFVEAIATYTPPDNFVSNAAVFLAASLNASCKAGS